MPLEVGRLQSVLKLNSSDFEKGVEKAKKDTRALGGELNKELKEPIKNTKTAMKDMREEVENTSEGINDFTEEVKDANEGLKDMETRAENAASKTEKVGEKAKESSGFIDDLRDVLGKVGVAVGLSALIEAIKEIGTRALQSADEYDDAMRSIAVSTGAQGTALENYSEIVGELAREMGYTKGEIAQTLGTVKSLNRAISDENLKTLTAEYQALQGLLQSIGQSVDIRQIDSAFKKWGITVEEQTKYLGYFYALAQDTGVEINTLAQLLADGDRAFMLLGMSAEEAARYISDANMAGEIGDVAQLIGAVERLQATKAVELGSDESAAKYIQDMMAAAAAFRDEGEAMNYLAGELEVSALIAGRFTASAFSGAEDIGKTNIELEEMRDLLKEIDTAAMSTEQKNTQFAENWGKKLEPIGNRLQGIRDNLLDISKMESTIGAISEMLYIRGWLMNGAMYNNPDGSQSIGYIQPSDRVAQNSGNTIIINQEINAPVYDTNAAKNAAVQAEKAQSRRMT